MTFTTLFSGFGGKCWGFKAAGLTPINHFELDPRIAEVGQANSAGRYIVGDVCDADWLKYDRPDVLGASPVCKSFSVANSDGEESAVDIATAEATARAIKAWKPRVFFLENVYGYRNSVSFQIILATLKEQGYSFDYWHLNSADFGVPQTRKRLILVAVLESGHSGAQMRINRPEPTHARNPTENLFGCLERWNGWYDAIEDLIPGLPESKFADWQLERLKDVDWAQSFLQMSGNTQMAHPTGTGVLTTGRPANTVMAGDNLRPRGWIVDGQNSSREITTRCEDLPSPTVVNFTRPSHMPLALLVSGGQNKGGTEVTKRWAQDPMYTVTAEECIRTVPRAFIVEGSAAGPNNDYTMPVRMDHEPVFTMRARQNNPRAFEGGRVVSMTPRALARFQSIPDDFELSGHRKTDCTGIGNAVPPLLSQRVIESAMEQLRQTEHTTSRY